MNLIPVSALFGLMSCLSALSASATLPFKQALKARYLKVVVKSAVGNVAYTHIAELDVINPSSCDRPHYLLIPRHQSNFGKTNSKTFILRPHLGRREQLHK